MAKLSSAFFYARKLIRLTLNLSRPTLFRFALGHYYLNKDDLCVLENALNKGRDDALIHQFERRFAAEIGEGECVSYAAARMAFFDLLQVLGVKSGDEVILLGFTCSVMANAVLRTGASIVYSDLDEETYGSNPASIQRLLSPQTKMIVAQHSFGIPCRIHEIQQIARKHGVFLLEDCAISFGSKCDGVPLGRFGDAAIFSNDHTKPVNTLIGGLLYTEKKEISRAIRAIHQKHPDFTLDHQRDLFNRILFERAYYYPRRYERGDLLEAVGELLNKKKSQTRPVLLTDEYTSPQKSISASYPYPARLPSFLAKLGLLELERWGRTKALRMNRLRRFLEKVRSSGAEVKIPARYMDSSCEIVPLRFVYQAPDPGRNRALMSRFVDPSQFWFAAPVICCEYGLSDFEYQEGMCPTSERVSANIINWPFAVPDEFDRVLDESFQSVLANG
ncbi:MAG: hypothetical protein GC154_08915 [bacterium]|nr:hypothetical protein [bacterium]